MKINCEIVQDLLPLYEDGVCTESSRIAVEAHLAQCPHCRASREALTPLPEEAIQITADASQAADSFRKVRRRWGASLLAIVLALPLLLLLFNQIRGRGMCFSNWDDMYVAWTFVKHLKQGEYEQAAAMYDFSGKYDDVMAVLEKNLEDYTENHIAVQIGEETWYADPGIMETLQPDEEPRIIWETLIDNRQSNPIIVPETVWEEIVTAGDMVRQQVGNGFELSNGRSYYAVDTPWGIYYFSDTAYQTYMNSEKSNLSYAQCSYLLPETIYQDIYPELIADATVLMTRNLEMYGPAKGMNLQEFEDYMRNKYAQELAEGFGSVTISEMSFDRFYRMDTRWEIGIKTKIVYSGRLVAHREETACFWISPHIQNGKIVSMGTMSDRQDFPEDVTEALFPGFWF